MSGKVESCANSSYAILTLSCDICHKYFNGKKPYKEHLQSNNHKKKLKEKTLLDIASPDCLNPQVVPLHADGEYKNKDLEVKKKAVDDFQYKKLLSEWEKNKILPFAESKSAKDSLLSPGLFPKSDDRECEQFYVECAVCQLYFTSRKNAGMHFSSAEHKRKDAHHREIEELYNSIKNVDIQEVVENLLYETPPLNTSGKNMKTKDIIGTTAINHKPEIIKADGLKLKLADSKTKEKKLYPGCELCGISSFSSIISSLNHLTTTEHCRRSAMEAEATKFNSKISNELSSVISSSVDSSQKATQISYEDIVIPPNFTSLNPDHCYRSYKEEKRNSDKVSLNPIGYERKQKHKQHQQSDIYSIEKPLCLPDNYNFDYDGKASSTAQCFSEVLLNPFTQEYKTLLSNDLPLATQTLSQMGVSKPFPRLAATFPQSNLTIKQKDLSGIEIIGPDQDFPF